MEHRNSSVVGVNSLGLALYRHQLVNPVAKDSMAINHSHFTKSQKRHAKALHKQFKRNQPAMFNDARNSIIRSIVTAKDVALNVVNVDIRCSI